jgi:hypothetical protein
MLQAEQTGQEFRRINTISAPLLAVLNMKLKDIRCNLKE